MNKQASSLLLKLLEHAFDDGWRTANDFIRHFTAKDIIESLAHDEDLRVRMLVSTTGMHEKIAKKKPIASASEDLSLALEEGTTEPSEVLNLYPPEARVRYLDTQRLWGFLTEGDFWTVGSGEGTRHTRAAARITFTLETALAEGLITLQQITDGITFEEIASSLPKGELEQIVIRSLGAGREKQPLVEDLLLEIVPLKSLVEYVELSSTWNRVVVDKIASVCGYLKATGSTPGVSSSGTGGGHKFEASKKSMGSEVRSPARLSVTGQSPTGQSGSTPAASASPTSGSTVTAASSAAGSQLAGAQVATAGAAGSVPDEVSATAADDLEAAGPDPKALEAVRERLQMIGRLPPDENVPFSILMSIESMYVELKEAQSDEERADAVREAFPNQQHLRTAMLALVELLDPTVDTKDPVIRDADVDALIKIVLFEERRRRDNNRTSSLPPPPPGMGKRRSRSVPPPLPKNGNGDNIDSEVELDV